MKETMDNMCLTDGSRRKEEGQETGKSRRQGGSRKEERKKEDERAGGSRKEERKKEDERKSLKITPRCRRQQGVSYTFYTVDRSLPGDTYPTSESQFLIQIITEKIRKKSKLLRGTSNETTGSTT